METIKTIESECDDGQRRHLDIARAYALAWLDIRESVLCSLGAEPSMKFVGYDWPTQADKAAGRVSLMPEIMKRLVSHAEDASGDDINHFDLASAILSEQAALHNYVIQVEWEPGILTGE